MMKQQAGDALFANCTMHIDCPAIAYNLEVLRKKTRSRIMAVLKNDGYGLSLLEYARVLTELGITDLAVGSYEEAMALRGGGIGNPLLLLTPQCSVTAIRNLIRQDVMLAVGGIQQADDIRRASTEEGRPAKVHIKIDTGLGRYGFQMRELHLVGAAVKELDVQGVYTHFSSPYSSVKTTRRQFGMFEQAVSQLKHNNVNTGLLHCCASGALLNYPEMHLDMVRTGSALLGRVPRAQAHGLVSAVSLKAPIVMIKTLPGAPKIGYNRSVNLAGNTRIGILNVGGACGLVHDRRACGLFRAKQYAMVNNQCVEILGSLGIGSLALNLGGIRCLEGDMAQLEINPLLCAAGIPRVFVRPQTETAAGRKRPATPPARACAGELQASSE